MTDRPFLAVTPPLPPDAWLRRARAPLPFPLEGTVAIHARARAALYQGLRTLGLGPGDTALLPAYHHGSEVEAYVRAGIAVRFYDTGPGLLPDPAGLEMALTPDVKAIHLIHYLGLASPVAAWRAVADRRGLALVEDVAQGWLGRTDGAPLGATGDIALFSVYKSVGVPDGGVAIVRGARLVPTGVPHLGMRAITRRHGMFVAGRSARMGAARARRVAERPYDATRDFALGDPGTAADRSTLPLLRRLATPDVAERRRDNYRTLLAALGTHVPAPYRVDPADASPFAFPVFAGDKPGVLATLRGRGIGAVDAWSVPHPALEVDAHPGAARWRSGIVLLPVHQELRRGDVARIARDAAAALESTSASGAPV